MYSLDVDHNMIFLDDCTLKPLVQDSDIFFGNRASKNVKVLATLKMGKEVNKIGRERRKNNEMKKEKHKKERKKGKDNSDNIGISNNVYLSILGAYSVVDISIGII
jgi:hypothetical protein